jgi:hypothetical protein
LPNPAETVAPAAAPANENAGAPHRPASVFVRAIDLPTPSLRQARAAVAQQLDILSPLPPAETAHCVVLLGPAEDGLCRYAVGFVPRASLAGGAPADRIVTLFGVLDGRRIPFRFDRGRGAAVRKAASRSPVEIVTIAGACVAIVLAAANVRVDQALDRAQDRLDSAQTSLARRGREAAAVSRVAAAWRDTLAMRNAGVVDCGLRALSAASGGQARLARLSLSGSELKATLSAPPADATLTALRAAGFAPAAADPSTAGSAATFTARAPACP